MTTVSALSNMAGNAAVSITARTDIGEVPAAGGGLVEWLPQLAATALTWLDGVCGWWTEHTAPAALADTALSAPWETLGWFGLGLGVIAGVGFAALRRRYRTGERAVWLQVTPPAQLPAEAGSALWRLLSGVLRRSHGGWSGWWAPPPRLALEWWADAAGVRPGVWVPETIRAATVADAIRRAWPGATVTETHPPVWYQPPPGRYDLAPTGSRWTPLLDSTRAGSARGTGPTAASEEPLRAVLTALAERRPGEQACVQLVLTAHRGPLSGVGAVVAGGSPATGLARLLRAVTPSLLGTLAGSIAFLVLGLLDLFTPGRSTVSRGPISRGNARGVQTHSGSARADHVSDPVAAAASKAIDAKRAAGPHLHATLRVAVNTPTRAHTPARQRHGRIRAARPIAAGLAADIAAGFDLVTTAPHSGSGLRARWHSYSEPFLLRTPGTGFMATVAELAALWHLPAEPARYRLPDPTAALRTPGMALPRATLRPPTNPTTNPTTPAGPDTPSDGAVNSSAARRRAPSHLTSQPPPMRVPPRRPPGRTAPAPQRGPLAHPPRTTRPVRDVPRH